MTDITHILNAIEAGDPNAANELLPLVYDELRKLAAARMAREAADHTLQPTALVHEAYLRLVGGRDGGHWDGRGHFFAAAAKAMRRILVDNARKKNSLRGGAGRRRQELRDNDLTSLSCNDELIDLDDALKKFGRVEDQAAALVELRVFGGLSVDEAARQLGISRSTAKRQWAYALAWLRREIGDDREPDA